MTLTAFLHAVFPSIAPSERIELRAKLPSGMILQRWAASVPLLLHEVRRIRDNGDVWFGAALRVGEHGDAAHVTSVGTLWCDTDAKCFHGGKEQAMEAIRALPLPPSAVVDTGGGFHPYWFLRTPSIAVEAEDDARAALCGIRSALESNAGRPLDRVDDLPRVLRLPGTKNHKYTPAYDVRVIEFQPSRRYALGDFRGNGLWKAARSRPASSQTVRPRPLAPSRRSLPWVDEALNCPDRFIRRSPSELDFAVVCRLVETVGANQAEAIWLASSLGAREKVQQRPDYRERTLRAALAATVPEKSVPPAVIRVRVA